jgi:flagellar M-ring protein FliF
MAEYQNQVQNPLVGFLGRLTLRQKLLMGTVTVAALAAILGLVSLVNRPSMGTLFSNLNPQDASKIVEKLKEKGIPYTLEDGGKTVLVPKQQIYDMRLALAGEGLPQSSVIGYEIFDRTNLGVSDFVQKVNYRRALEGELARTILQLDEVEGARVHIVVPEKALFKEDEKPATASVVLKLHSGKPLKRETIQGISHLVASSIEGMEASNVTIVDSRGLLLSDNSKSNSLASLTSTQYDLQQRVESYLMKKAQSMLEGVVGVGNALVQVSVELDFRQAEHTLEQYDPDNTTVRSEQKTEERTALRDSAPPSTRTNSVTNYEVNKTIEHIVENVGSIKRLSVASLVNGTEKVSERNGEKAAEYVPRKPEEITQLTDIVKKAVGFNAERNDQVSMVNLPFGTNIRTEDLLYKQTPFGNYTDLLEKIFLVIAMIGAVLIIRSLLSRMRVRVAVEQGTYHAEPAMAAIRAKKAAIRLPSPEEEISEDVLIRSERRTRISEYMQNKPDEASRLLKVWLAEE